MISEPARYILNLTDSPYGKSGKELRFEFITMAYAIGAGIPDNEEFNRFFSEAINSGQMTEWKGHWYSNERYQPPDAFTKFMSQS